MRRLSLIPLNEARPGESSSRRNLLRNGFRFAAGCVGAGSFVSLLSPPAAAEGERDKHDRGDRERPERDGGDRPEGPPPLPPFIERELAAKAQYLIALPRFVEWPAEVVPRPDSPIVIGVLAKPEFFGFLHRFIGERRIDGRPVLLKPVRKPGDARDCHILYVNSRVSERTPRVMHFIPKDQPILTVGESPHFLEQGGILNFAVGERKIVLEVNCEAARRASLTISKKLLGICKQQPPKDEDK